MWKHVMDLLQQAIGVVRDRKNLMYQTPLSWDIQTIRQVYDLAQEQGIPNEAWLPAIQTWLRLDYAIQNKSKTTKLPCKSQAVEDMYTLSQMLGIDVQRWIQSVHVKI